MTKLIFCDIDGTLLHGQETALDQRYFDEIIRLRKKGIIFAPATGRQYFGIRQLFAPVANDIYCISENGSAVFSPENGGTLLSSIPLEQKSMQNICRDAIDIEGCSFFATSPHSGYVLEGHTEPVDYLSRLESITFSVVQNLTDIPNDICKISVFCRDGLEFTHKVENILGPKYRDQYNIAIAGDKWLDFTFGSKSTGAAVLCSHLGIDFSDVLAIGDNYNDADLLEIVGNGYIMENAENALKSHFPLHCENVLDLLRTI